VSRCSVFPVVAGVDAKVDRPVASASSNLPIPSAAVEMLSLSRTRTPGGGKQWPRGEGTFERTRKKVYEIGSPYMATCTGNKMRLSEREREREWWVRVISPSVEDETARVISRRRGFGYYSGAYG
jgi:hypothetical protein